MIRFLARFTINLALAASILGTRLCAADKPVNLRLGTLAPRGSSYHKSLQSIGEKWRQISGGAVRLTIYPDGTQGGEADMVGLMQTGNLDAGLLTAIGLAEVEPDVTALQSMPMAFRTLDEVDYVGEKLRPLLENAFWRKDMWCCSGPIRAGCAFFPKARWCIRMICGS